MRRRPPSRERTPRFTLLFLGLIAIFAVLTASSPAQSLVHRPLGRLLTILAVPLLSPFGAASAAGSILKLGDFSAAVEEACDGVLPTCIYLAGVVAYPARWRDKWRGILIGVPTIFVINLARIVTLMIVGANWPVYFEQVHIYVWQALVIALSLGVWVFWIERIVRSGVRASA